MEICENCGKVIGLKETTCLYQQKVVCEPCHTKLVMIDSGIQPKVEIVVAQKSQIVQKSKVKRVEYRGPTCQYCGGPMKKTSTGTDPVLHLIAAFILFCFGIFLIVVFPVFGWLIGGTIVVMSLVKGSGYKKVLKCRECGALADRK